MTKVELIPQSCKGLDDCGICVFVCPKSLFFPSEELNEAGYLPPGPPDQEECTACGNCMIYCPDFAIVVTGEKVEEDEDDE